MYVITSEKYYLSFMDKAAAREYIERMVNHLKGMSNDRALTARWEKTLAKLDSQPEASNSVELTKE